MAVNCFKFDFTLKYDETHDHIEIIECLLEFCKKFVFQLELSEGNYKHWQGRVSLIKKKRLGALIVSSKEYEPLKNIHWSVTSSNSTNFNYVMKADTRIDGPWTDQDTIQKPTKQMTLFKSWTLREWQSELIAKTSQFCLRSIDLVYDPTGNAGKSLFSEYMELQGKAEEVPPFRLMDDIFQWVCTRPIKQIYIVDMPRGMKKDKLGDFYSGIEVIKNGVAYDKRYSAKKIRFDRPRIIVFSNELPNFELMSEDRWVLWTITDNKLSPMNCLDQMNLDD